MKADAFFKEIDAIAVSAFTAAALFLVVLLVFYIIGVKAFDLWLLAGLSLVYCASRFIFRSPSMASFITNKANIWLSSIVISFLMIAEISFAVFFLLVTILAGLNLYEINPFIDVSISLVISAFITVIIASFLKMREKPRENIL